MNVLFDLDGTLTDPRRGILACIKYALGRLGVNSPSDHDLERFIGPPLRASFSQLLLNSERDVDQAVTLYRERFAAKGRFENRVYPGIAEALAQLRERGAWLGLATAKPRVFAEPILEHFGLARFFHAVYGSELDGRNANKSDLLAHLLNAESLSPTDTFMMGDRAHDVVAAKANGIFPIGVLWGYGSREELLSAGAGRLCEEPKRLVEVVGWPTRQSLRM